MTYQLRWRGLYRGRAAVEREFGRLNNEWALSPLRVRGLECVQLHADLTILAKLAIALCDVERQAGAARHTRSPLGAVHVIRERPSEDGDCDTVVR